MESDDRAGFEAASLAAEHWLANINTAAMFASNGLVEETVAVVQQVLDQCRTHSHVLNSPEVTTALALASDSAVSADGKLYPSAHHAALSLSQRWLHELWRCVDEAEGVLDWAYASHDEDRRFDPGRLRECDWRPIAEWMSGFCADHELELWSANIAVLILRERANVVSQPAETAETSAESQSLAGVSSRQGDDAIVWRGGGCVSVPGFAPFVVSDNEDTILQTFLESPAMDGPTLVSKSGIERAGKLLRTLATKYDSVLSPYITLPGGKGKGGYAVNIRRAQ